MALHQVSPRSGRLSSHRDRLLTAPLASSLMIKQENIDVNVHPTKKEVRQNPGALSVHDVELTSWPVPLQVHFLNEEEIVDEICRAVEKVLVGANESRDFAVQVCPARRRSAGFKEAG